MYVASLTVIGEGERETRRDETPSPQIHIGAVDLKHRFNVLFRIPWTYHLFSSVPCMSSSVNLFQIELFLRYNNSALDIFALSLVTSLPPAPRPVVSSNWNRFQLLGHIGQCERAARHQAPTTEEFQAPFGHLLFHLNCNSHGITVCADQHFII